MAKLRQKTAFGPGVYRGIPFTRERIAQYVESSNKALMAGIPIPLLKVHAPINADDKATSEAAEKTGKGWIKSYFQDEDGALGWEADNVPDDFAKAVEAGAMKTSPEFRNSYESEKAGVFTGPIIRHIAFTDLPGNPHQSPVETIALEELGVFQFSEYDLDNNPTSEKTFDDVDNEDEDEDDLKNKKKKKDDEGAEGPITDETSQHNEERAAKEHSKYGKMGEAVAHHGYGSVGNGFYSHKASGSKVEISKHNEGWNHTTTSGKRIKSGKSHADLVSHLAGYHGSQHAEIDDKTAKKKATPDVPEATDDPAEVTDPVDIVTPENPPAEDNSDPLKNNPDAPPKATDKSQLAAIIAGLAQAANVVLPSDWDMKEEGAEKILLGCLNTAIKAKQSNEAEEANDKDDEESTPAPVSMPFSEGGANPTLHDTLLKSHGYKKLHDGGKTGRSIYGHKSGHSADVYPDGKWTHYHARATKTGHESIQKTGGSHRDLSTHLADFHGSQHSEQYSEDELAALPPKFKAIIEAGIKKQAEDAKARQFAEEQAAVSKATLAKERAIAGIQQRKLPPAVEKVLLKTYDNAQFSEGVEPAIYTASQVADIFSKAIPPSLLFDRSGVKHADVPKEVNQAQFFEREDMPTGHVGREKAEAIVAASPIMRQMPRATPLATLNGAVAAENAKNPNLVMRNG